MVAVRQFDTEKALGQIMEAFWREGYLATTIDDLVAATGLKRGSLYGAFSDKQAMFLAAFKRYRDLIEPKLKAALEVRNLTDAIRAIFRAQISELQMPRRPAGCLIAMTMSEAAGRGDPIEAAAEKAHADTVEMFRSRLAEGRRDGQLPAPADIDALARFYAATLRTIAITHRLTGDTRSARDIANVAMAPLK